MNRFCAEILITNVDDRENRQSPSGNTRPSGKKNEWNFKRGKKLVKYSAITDIKLYEARRPRWVSRV